MQTDVVIGNAILESGPGKTPQELKAICMRRLAKRYGGQPDNGRIPEGVLETLNRELERFADEDLLGTLLSLGRMWAPVVSLGKPWAVQGSAASSLVLFGIGLLPFCPADHGLLFDRFRPDTVNRGGLLEIPVLVSPEVLALIRSIPTPEETDEGKGIRLELLEIQALKGHGHWEKVQPFLKPPTPEQVQVILSKLETSQAKRCPGLEGSWVCDFIRQARPVTFEDLVVCQQLNHPSRIEAGWPEVFAEVLDNSREIKPPKNREQSLLAGTRGLPMFQEDLMEVLSQIGGIEKADAYLLLRSICGNRKAQMEQGKREFMRTAMRKGVAQSRAENLFALIHVGAPLATCKANAISMGYLAAGALLAG